MSLGEKEKPSPRRSSPMGRVRESKWPNSWRVMIVSFWVLEACLKFVAEIQRPNFCILDVSPYFAIGATHYRNPNSCLGVLRGFSPITKFAITTVSVVGLMGLVAYIHFAPSSLNTRRGMAFLIAGAVGNLFDRVLLGVVVDYVYIQLGDDGEILYLAWNISDILINIGIIFFLYASFMNEPPFGDTNKEKEKGQLNEKVGAGTKEETTPLPDAKLKKNQ